MHFSGVFWWATNESWAPRFKLTAQQSGKACWLHFGYTKVHFCGLLIYFLWSPKTGKCWKCNMFFARHGNPQQDWVLTALEYRMFFFIYSPAHKTRPATVHLKHHHRNNRTSWTQHKHTTVHPPDSRDTERRRQWQTQTERLCQAGRVFFFGGGVVCCCVFFPRSAALTVPVACLRACRLCGLYQPASQENLLSSLTNNSPKN